MQRTPGQSLAQVKQYRTVCAVCGGGSLQQVIDLPGLPHTGYFVHEGEIGAGFPSVDQALLWCPGCGHAQLGSIIAPEFLYDQSYEHRTSASPMAMSGNDFLARFVEELAPGVTFDTALEVGCNDLYLLRQLSTRARQLVGIDPLWLTAAAPPAPANVSVVGAFVGDGTLRAAVTGSPGLVVSAHTFEHLEHPAAALAELMDLAAAGALFVIEVPCFDTLLTNIRFDQVFHQHLHYYSVASLHRLVAAAGGDYVRHVFNYDYWGGTLLYAFRKPLAGAASLAGPACTVPTAGDITRRYGLFRGQMRSLMDLVTALVDEPIYGYGAAQMIPVLAYHLQSDLGFLQCILDDNPDKDGLGYPDLPVRIRYRPPGMSLRNAAVLITALDSFRPMLERLLPARPRHLFAPLQMVWL